MTTVVLAAAVANRHGLGGSIWVRRSWTAALQRLGFEVFLLDDLSPDGTPDAFAQTTNELGVAGALLDGDKVHGCERVELLERLDSAELLVNLGGHLRNRELLRRPRVRAFVDLDPGYTQIWHAQGYDVGLAGHDHYFTVGTNVGTPASTLPGGDIDWRAIRQPVVLEDWPVSDGEFTSFSTIGSWRRAFGPLQWRGRTYGPKAHQFRRFATLPETVGLPFEAALASTRRTLATGSCSNPAAGGCETPASSQPRPESPALCLPPAPSSRPPRTSTSRPRAAGSATAPFATSPAAGPPSCKTPASSKHCRSGTDCSSSER